MNIGLLPVVLAGDDVAVLQEAAMNPTNEVVIDLESQTVTSGDFAAFFDIDPHVKYRLLAGLDNIGETLLHEDAITTFEAGRAAYKPSLG